mgnify:CR=1 FL=1
MILLLLVSTWPAITRAKTNNQEYVRTANMFLWSGPFLDQSLESLSHFDVLVLPVESQVYNKSFFQNIRKKNPDIVLLSYIPTVSWNNLYWTDPLHQSMYANIQSDWWLTDASGNQISVWPNTRALNLNSGWITYLAQQVKNDVLSTGYWDGIFYDEVQDSISWVGTVDVNRDGKNDTTKEADTSWAKHYTSLFEATRAAIGHEPILMTNGSSNAVFSPFVNGRMFETFPSSHQTLAEWKQMTSQYTKFENTTGYSAINIINVNTDNTQGLGTQTDYQAMRFGLTTTLLGDGYFSYDAGSTNHAVIWEYDEYNAFLGAPKSQPINTFNPQQTSIDVGVWQRDFTNGKIIVNATAKPQTIVLLGDFEKLHGLQDPKTNNGAIVSQITLPSQDGIVLLRPIDQLNDASFLNGAFARIFNEDGIQKRTGFFSYDSSFQGGTQIIRYDIDQDGEREIVVANQQRVFIYESNGSLHASFAPYGENYNKGINISIGDLEQDGSVEIVTGTENGGGPHVRVFNQDGVLINPGFFAYAPQFRGGVNVTIGDLNKDGIKEIITGAGFGGGPHVRVFNKDGTLINPGFFAYEPKFRGGVHVSVGDVDGDGLDDLVTGPGFGGAPLARVYDRNGTMKTEFYVFDPSQRRGLNMITNDVDGDGTDEIIGLSTDVFTLNAFSQ